jgi:YVTN family beta-propeller protein
LGIREPYAQTQQQQMQQALTIAYKSPWGSPTHVGKYPTGISVDKTDWWVYVANTRSGTISIINGKSNRVVVGVNLNVQPSFRLRRNRLQSWDEIFNQWLRQSRYRKYMHS